MIVQVKDRYNRKMYVDDADLSNAKKKLLPLYTRGGVRLSNLPSWDRRVKEYGSTCVIRENICPHPLESFKTAMLLGDKFKYCPACAPQMEEYQV